MSCLTLVSGDLLAQNNQQLLEKGLREYSSGLFEESAKSLESILRFAPDQIDAYLPLSASLVQLGRFSEAEEWIDKGLIKLPQSRNLKLLKAEVLLQQGLMESALPLYEKLLSEGTGQNQDGGISDRQLEDRIALMHQRLGYRFLQEEDAPSAIPHLRKALKHMPDTLGLHQNLVFALSQTNKIDAAYKASKAARKRFPRAIPILRLQAALLYELKDQEGLLEVYGMLHQLQPNDLDIGLNYGQVLLINQKRDEANEVFEGLLKTHPKNESVYQVLTQVQEQQFNVPGMIRVLREKRKNFPDDPETLSSLGILYTKIKQYEQAKAVFDTLSTMPGQLKPARIAKSYLFEVQDSLALAMSPLEEILADGKRHENILLAKARLLRKQEKLEESRELLEELIAFDPSLDAYVRMAELLEQMGDENGAVAFYRSAMGVGNPGAWAYDRLSSDELRKGNSEEAFVLLNKAIAAILSGEEEKQDQSKQESIISSIDVSRDPVRTSKVERDQSTDEASQIFEHFIAWFDAPSVENVLVDLVEEYPGSGRLHLVLADFYMKENRTDLAKTNYEQAVYFSPKFRPTQIGLAKYQESTGDLQGALLSFERALSMDETKPEVYPHLLRLYSKLGRLDALCDRWIARYHSADYNPVLKEYLIEALHKADRFDEARKYTQSK